MEFINFTKEVVAIKKIIEKMRAKLSALESVIESREKSFNDKSEKWQDGGKGQAHAAKTSDMQDEFYGVESAIENIESELSELTNY